MIDEIIDQYQDDGVIVEKLVSVKNILGKLEENDIVGEVATVDVSNLYNLELQYGQRYQVKLGDTSEMERKISEMKQAVAQLNDYQSGILDASFKSKPDGVVYKAFSE